MEGSDVAPPDNVSLTTSTILPCLDVRGIRVRERNLHPTAVPTVVLAPPTPLGSVYVNSEDFIRKETNKEDLVDRLRVGRSIANMLQLLLAVRVSGLALSEYLVFQARPMNAHWLKAANI